MSFLIEVFKLVISFLKQPSLDISYELNYFYFL